MARHIAPIIEAHRRPGQLYLEPFVGGGTILCAVGNPRYGSDKCRPLVTMWRHLQRGWLPPSALTEEEWRWYRDLQDPDDPMTAFAGFGCSFGGSWFQAYARSGGTNIAASVRRGLAKQQRQVQGVQFHCGDYRGFDPDDLMIYCDPPYKATAGYKAVGQFDSEEFWDTMFRWAKRNTVLVSEFSAPDDPGVDEVWSIKRKVTLAARGSYSERTDRLYRVWG